MFVTTPVLVVDDCEMIREIIVFQLQDMGFWHIHTAGSGEEALRLLESMPIKLILSDWSMAGMSGLELLEAVRRHETQKGIAFILVTAEMQRERAEQALKAGVNDFLLKPFKPDEFASTIHAVLSGRRSPVWRVADKSGDRTSGELGSIVKSANSTVLVVDDAPSNLTLALELLRGDYQVKLALRGSKALELCESSPPDLILLDIMMPEMDGFEVCRRLKADPATAHIPVIFLTALDDVARTVQGLELGAVDYVTKPIEPAILSARVASALRIARAREELREQYDLMIENARLREDVEQMTRHDLKNPLAGIIGMASNLLADKTLAIDHQRQAKAIELAAYDILELIHLSGDLWKMEQGRYQLNPLPVDFPALVLRVAEETQHSFAGKEIGVETMLSAPAENTGVVLGESLLLYSMLHNLTKNAAEASKDGETVRIELFESDASVKIIIHNSGTVPVEIRDRFFERYVTHGKTSGTGLGTYSAKLIVEAHAGMIDMETSIEDGTFVTVSFPLNQGEMRQSHVSHTG